MTDALAQIDELFEAGDVGGALRQLRFVAADVSPVEIARRLRRAGEAAGFDDVVDAADAVLARGDDAHALYDLGYACVGRGIPAIAIPLLAAALERAPGQLAIVRELAVAYESVYRYADAVAVLAANEAHLEDWPDRYLLAFNSIMAGDLDRAARYHSGLSTPDGDWAAGYDRLAGMLERAGQTTDRGLRGWHYILNASVLASLSPYGFDDGMNGRYAFIQDSPDNCARTLRRLKTALGDRPGPVSPLPDRASRILGLAAGIVLDRPVVPWPPSRPDAVIVAYNLNDLDPDMLPGLRERGPGAVLVEHAACWTDPPLVAADFVGLLQQSIVEPWGKRLMAPPGEPPYRTEPDQRSEADIAAEITANPAEPAEVAPGDGDDQFAAFLTSIHSGWPSPRARRDRMWSPGPISSSFFA